MANSNFIVQNGLTVGPLTIDAATGSLTTTGTITSTGGGPEIFNGNVVANSGVASTTTTTGALVVVGGMGVSGAIVANTVLSDSITTSNGGQHIGYHTGAIGANTANTGVFTTLTATSGYQGAVNGPFNGTVGATTANTGVFTSLTATTGYNGSVNGAMNGTIGATTANTGAFTTLTTSNTIAATGIIYGSGGVQGALSGPFNGTVGATTANSGVFTTLTATTGYNGSVNGAMNGTIGNTTANTGAFTTLTSSGLTTITNATDSASISGGALVITGGLGVGKNTFIGGSLTVVGNLAVQGNSTTIGSTDLTVNDSVINLHTYPNLAAWTVNDGRDIGFKLHYFDTALAGGDNLSFLGRANDTGYLEWYTTGAEGVGNVFTSGTYGTIKTGELVVANATTSTSTITGAFRVTGGAGIVGNIYSGGQIFGYHTGAIGANVANTGVFTTLTATSGYQGAVNGPFNGTVGASTANTGAFTTLTATDTTSAISSTQILQSVNGTYTIGLQPRSGGGYYNNLPANNDALLTFTSGTIGTGNLTIAPWAGASSGIRIQSVANVAAITLAGNVTTAGQTTLANTAATGLYVTNGVYWANGTAWSSTGTTYTASGTAPASPKLGDEWYNTSTDILYIRANDGTSSFWLDIVSTPSSMGNLTIGGNLTVSGTVNSGLNPYANNTYNLGTTTANWATVYAVTFSGTSTTAKYADLAENYEADCELTPGDVVIFGGFKEITIANQSHDTRVAGVVSTQPAYLMNSANPGYPIALTGRVPCMVKGPVDKGDLLVTSEYAGVAQKLVKALYEPGCVIGKSLEKINSDETKLIEVVVGRI